MSTASVPQATSKEKSSRKSRVFVHGSGKLSRVPWAAGSEEDTAMARRLTIPQTLRATRAHDAPFSPTVRDREAPSSPYQLSNSRNLRALSSPRSFSVESKDIEETSGFPERLASQKSLEKHSTVHVEEGEQVSVQFALGLNSLPSAYTIACRMHKDGSHLVLRIAAGQMELL
ncbi:hypothetical protein SISNIDRAFT_488162 [Sistotremastrum niveocremeum HHB9708]|uniref:Uncharacterized protein n=1 Tax=Sistotremastrum niveocremeum HHB9708 TaxID=1314777 RepID=A0A164RII6_9AGAM|nr:hypothetical protein SISNIDRAFT_488162 [Sistotremastrum niveocremeum HHB9708]